MTRILLIPSTTPDGRHIVLRVVAVARLQRLRRLARRLRLPTGRNDRRYR